MLVTDRGRMWLARWHNTTPSIKAAPTSSGSKTFNLDSRFCKTINRTTPTQLSVTECQNKLIMFIYYIIKSHSIMCSHVLIALNDQHDLSSILLTNITFLGVHRGCNFTVSWTEQFLLYFVLLMADKLIFLYVL